MSLDITFAPLIPAGLLIALALAALAIVVLGLVLRARGALLRFAALGFLVLALAGPSLNREEREPINDVVAMVIDRSQSTKTGARTQAADQAAAQIGERLAQSGGIDLRVIEAGSDAEGDGTRLFERLSEELRDVPSERLGGVILLTDGQVHDVPETAAGLGLEAPVHALITGERNEADRKLIVLEAPRFGIVGQVLEFSVKVEDLGAEIVGPTPEMARLSVRIDGGDTKIYPVPVGRARTIEFELAHGGENVVELEVEPGPSELTLQNNRAVIIANGVRDRLRVLLVSGEPHAGERTWRNLLKADPSVELVHFTILRPPEKQDDTPDTELALIGFPVRELFSTKLYDFDLIIFDRYRRREVIPTAYFAYMADYVESGGALLVAAGPDFNSPNSIANTALVTLLPAQPTSRVFEEGYLPRVSDLGFRHPVTAGLTGANLPASDVAPSWGRWFRLVDTDVRTGEVLMTGPQDRPLLILDTAGKGRVAQLMSDQAWLWARGFEGGGPQAELLRRLAHWLMKEPDLEEEILRGTVKGRQIEITRQTMADAAQPVEVASPSGVKTTITLEERAPGRFTAQMPIDEVGLYHMSDGTLNAVVAVGPLNSREVSDMRATDEKLKTVAGETGGGIYWVGGKQGAVNVPAVRFIGEGRTASGRGWLGIRRNGAYVVTSLERTPLMAPLLALALVAGFFLVAWRRESQ